MTNENKPPIDRIEYKNTKNVTIWLENGAKIRYKTNENRKIQQDTYEPNDPHSIFESTTISEDTGSVREYALDWLEWYTNAPIEEIQKGDFSKCLIGEK